MRFDDRVTGDLSAYARNARVIHVDVHPAEIGKNVRPDLAVVADARIALTALCSLDPPRVDSGCCPSATVATNADFLRRLAPDVFVAPHAIDILDRVTADDAVIVTDVGQHQMWEAQFDSHRSGRRLITSRSRVRVRRRDRPPLLVRRPGPGAHCSLQCLLGGVLEGAGEPVRRLVASTSRHRRPIRPGTCSRGARTPSIVRDAISAPSLSVQRSWSASATSFSGRLRRSACTTSFTTLSAMRRRALWNGAAASPALGAR
jgi:hypothetical protein